ncbi:MAG TPA: multicopper oxidase domain-containing protein, partial [Vicinamibacterales bacterium]|nr:multicopper oxidase domain-containing protein [Vicinamibacterales bacterium]
LYYPTSGLPGRPWIPEFFGSALLVNGALFPYLEVEARRYRFRLLNASNSRFLHLALPGDLPAQQIAADQGLLPAPVPDSSIHLAPAERADVVIDFGAHAGRRVVLNNDLSGILQFRVAARRVRDDSRVPARLRDVPRLQAADAVRTRTLTLGEIDRMNGEPLRMLLNGTRWHAPVTETPQLGTTEVWNLVNITDDAHPIHLHLVRFQILERRAFDVFQYRTSGVVRSVGPPEAPEPSEAGWKDTVRAAPGMITRIIIPFDGYAGRYVWHCHILEHGDNEMMRPYEVRMAPA